MNRSAGVGYWLRLGLLMLAAASTASVISHTLAEEAEETTATGILSDHTASSLELDLRASYLRGDFGTGQRSDILAFGPRLRWVLPRGEFSLTVPFVESSNAGNVTFVGGSPALIHRKSEPAGASGPGGGPPPPPTSSETRSASGLGDALLGAAYDLVSGGERRPWVTTSLQVKLPTADETQGLGTGKTDVEATVDISQPIGRTNLLFGSGYTRVGRPAGTELRDTVRLSAGLSIGFGEALRNSLFAFVENRRSPLPGLPDRRDVSLGCKLRLGSQGKLHLSAAGLFGLTSTAEDFGLSLTMGRSF